MDDVWLPNKKYKNTVIARLYLSVKATIVQHTHKMFKKYLVISVTIFVTYWKCSEMKKSKINLTKVN